jgi:hypothetical protein
MLRNMSVANFKTLTGAAKFSFLVSPKTDGKLFVSGDNGMNFKCEAAIDYKKPIVVLIEDDDLDTACFINERENAAILHTI